MPQKANYFKIICLFTTFSAFQYGNEQYFNTLLEKIIFAGLHIKLAHNY